MPPVLAGAGASALLVAAYARGAWPLAFVALVPWLLALERPRTAAGALLAGVAMAVAFVAAAFGWFAPAIADYTGVPVAVASALLLAAAPLLQPQILAYALVRHAASRRSGAAMRALLAISAWIAVEWAVPRLFGDTLGHGLQPSRWLRQGADIAGAGGLTLVALAVNEAIATAFARRGAAPRSITRPIAVAAGLPVLLATYGALRLASLEGDASGSPVRIGLVQAAIVDYERLRRERGAHAVVREVLDVHQALSTQLRAGGADAIVWAETVYPTTFGQPRSDAGAAFDREIVAFAAEQAVPLVFGTYERDGNGEYNVAAFVDPLRGPLGAYRKTRLFPLTEHVPPAIDGPALRRAFPWAGAWRPGDGARVFPLFLPDGREVPVAPLICRDDVDPRLVRDAARLGARVLVGLSNDAWFTGAPLGARLHLAAASFRSVETRLPQVRATTNGMSAVIDRSGGIVARTAMDARAALLAQVQLYEPVDTPFLRWGNWLGPVSALVLLIAAATSLRRVEGGQHSGRVAEPAPAAWAAAPHRVWLLRSWQRAAIGTLRLVSRAAVAVLGVVALTADAPLRPTDQLRDVVLWVLLPELVAAMLARACAARMRIVGAHIVLDAPRRRIEIDRVALGAAEAWRLPWPQPGFDLRLASGTRWTYGIALRSAHAAMRVLTQAPPSEANRGPRPAARHTHGQDNRLPADPQHAVGQGDANVAGVEPAESLPGAGTTREPPADAGPGHRAGSRAWWLYEALDTESWRIDRPLVKFGLFALVPALPAFRLHQVIAYGSPFGELHTFGAQAYFTALGLWWASWAVTLVLIAGGLRALVEVVSAAVLALRPAHTPVVRRGLLQAARAAYFLGVPLWLALRLLDG